MPRGKSKFCHDPLSLQTWSIQGKIIYYNNYVKENRKLDNFCYSNFYYILRVYKLLQSTVKPFVCVDLECTHKYTIINRWREIISYWYQQYKASWSAYTVVCSGVAFRKWLFSAIRKVHNRIQSIQHAQLYLLFSFAAQLRGRSVSCSLNKNP